MKLTYRQVLSRPDGDGRCRVVLDVAWDGQRVKLPTGVACLPAHFRPAARQVILPKDPDATRLNNELAKVEGAVNAALARASAECRPVTADELGQAARAALGKKPAAPPQGPVDAGGESFPALLARWRQEHPTAPFNSRRRFNQVAAHLDAFRPGLTLGQLSRAVFQDYQAYLHGRDFAESTIGQHVKFLRACFRLADKTVPAWLAVKARYGRAVALRKAELQALARAELPPGGHLERERERVLFQTQLLLRDSDLRQLRPHHVTEQDVPGHGRLRVLEFHQQKTGDEVRLPLPPLAAAIWQRWEGRVPLISQQKRNAYIKELARAAGLDRPFVRVTFRGDRVEEVPLPVWQAVSTHTPRHTGADLVLLGSAGDQNLKEVALGHLAGASVYGYDTLDRYGPLFLQAWARVLGALGENAPGFGGAPPRPAATCAPVKVLIRPVRAGFLS